MHVVGHIERARGNILNIFSQIFPIWRGFFYGNTKLIPYLMLAAFGVGFYNLAKNRQIPLMVLSAGPYLTAFISSFFGAYPLSAGRHSLYLFLPSLIPLIGLFGLSKKKANLAIVCFLVCFLFLGFRSHQSLFTNWKEQSRPFVGIPAIKLEPFKVAAEQGFFQDGRVILDGGNSDSLWMEQAINPPWKIFDLKGLKYGYCTFGAFDSSEALCTCLKDMNGRYHNEHLFFIVLAGHRTSLNIIKYNDTTSCFQVLQKERLSEFLSVAKIRFLGRAS